MKSGGVILLWLALPSAAEVLSFAELWENRQDRLDACVWKDELDGQDPWCLPDNDYQVLDLRRFAACSRQNCGACLSPAQCTAAQEIPADYIDACGITEPRFQAWEVGPGPYQLAGHVEERKVGGWPFQMGSCPFFTREELEAAVDKCCPPGASTATGNGCSSKCCSDLPPLLDLESRVDTAPAILKMSRECSTGATNVLSPHPNPTRLNIWDSGNPLFDPAMEPIDPALARYWYTASNSGNPFAPGRAIRISMKVVIPAAPAAAVGIESLVTLGVNRGPHVQLDTTKSDTGDAEGWVKCPSTANVTWCPSYTLPDGQVCRECPLHTMTTTATWDLAFEEGNGGSLPAQTCEGRISIGAGLGGCDSTNGCGATGLYPGSYLPDSERLRIIYKVAADYPVECGALGYPQLYTALENGSPTFGVGPITNATPGSPQGWAGCNHKKCSRLSTPEPLAPGKEHELTFVYDDKTAFIYVDGELKASEERIWAVPRSITDVAIGAGSDDFEVFPLGQSSNFSFGEIKALVVDSWVVVDEKMCAVENIDIRTRSGPTDVISRYGSMKQWVPYKGQRREVEGSIRMQEWDLSNMDPYRSTTIAEALRRDQCGVRRGENSPGSCPFLTKQELEAAVDKCCPAGVEPVLGANSYGCTCPQEVVDKYGSMDSWDLAHIHSSRALVDLEAKKQIALAFAKNQATINELQKINQSTALAFAENQATINDLQRQLSEAQTIAGRTVTQCMHVKKLYEDAKCCGDDDNKELKLV